MIDSLFDQRDKVVLVSGGSRGIGEAIARGFAERNAHVVITSRDAASLVEAVTRVDVGAGAVKGVVCDVADRAAIADGVAQAMDTHGRIDTLVNCAGINIRKPAIDYTPDEFDAILGTNLRGAFHMSQAVGKLMIDAGKGSQINIDSLSTHVPLYRVVPYSMGKTAMSAMTKGLALEWGQFGVRVNALAPGFILTELTEKLWAKPKMQSWNNVVAPLRRLGTPEDMIGTALFLASEASAFMTGQVLRVDGGVSAGMRWPIDDDFDTVEN